MAERQYLQGFRIKPDAAEGVNALKQTREELDRLERTQRGATASSKQYSEQTKKTSDTLVNMRKAALTLIPALSLAQITREFTRTAIETDRLMGSLETVTGSADNASAAFDKLEQFAKKTPFTLDQSVQGFIKLTALGLTPSERALLSYGNTAAAMGKNLNQMIEAVADASTFEFERLKEFGIKAKQQQDTVTFTFQGVQTTVAKNATAIEEYLQQIGENKFGDAMANQMERLPGKISNLQDNVDAMFRAFANEGGGRTLETIITGASDAVVWLTDNVSLMRDLWVSAFATIEKAVVNTTFGVQSSFLAILGKVQEVVIPNIVYSFDMLKIKVKEAFFTMLESILGNVRDWLNTLADMIGNAPFEFAQKAATDIRSMANSLADAGDQSETFAKQEEQAAQKRKKSAETAASATISALEKVATKRDQQLKLIDETALAIIEEGRATTERNKALEDLTTVNNEGAESTKTLSDAQQTLLDKLFPLEKAMKDYESDLKIINDLYEKGSPRQIEALRRLQLQYSQLFPEVARQEELATAFDKSWSRSIERIDDAFFDFFRGGLDGFEEFKDSAVDIVKDLVAQILLNWAKVKVLELGLNVNSIGGAIVSSIVGSSAAQAATGAGAGAAGGATAGLAAGGFGSLSQQVAKLLPSSLGGTFGTNPSLMSIGQDGMVADLGAGYQPGLDFKQLGLGILQSAVGGFVGQSLGKALTGREAQSSWGATIGAVVGSYIPVIGTFLGATLGGFLDSLFGSKKKDPRFNIESVGAGIAERQSFAREDIAVTTQSAFGGVRFQSNHDLAAGFTQAQADQFFGLFEGIKSLENAIADTLESSQVNSIQSVLLQQENLYRKNSLDFESFFADRFDLIFDTIGGAANKAFDDLTRGLTDRQVVESLDALSDAALIVGQAEGGLKTYFESLENITLDLVASGVVLSNTNSLLEAIDATLLPLNESGAEAAMSLLELAGGMENLVSLTGQISSLMEDTDTLRALTNSLRGVFSEMNLQLPTTRKEFLEILESLDLTVEEQRAQYVALLALVPQVSEYIDQLDERVQDLGASIETLIGEIIGDESLFEKQIRMEQERLARLNDAANELYLTELERYRLAQQSALTLSESLMSAADALLLGSDSPLTPTQRFQEAQRQYSQLLGMARGGDQGALNELMSFSATFIQIARQQFASSEQFQTIFSQVQSDLRMLSSGLVKAVETATAPNAPVPVESSLLLETLMAGLADEQARERDATRQAIIGELQSLASLQETTAAALLGDFGLTLADLVTDINNDGLISALEVNTTAMNLLAQDLDQNGRISKAELDAVNKMDLNSLVGTVNAGSFNTDIANMLDTNNDGIVSRLELLNTNLGEFDNSLVSQVLKASDTNKNGLLDVQEVLVALMDDNSPLHSVLSDSYKAQVQAATDFVQLMEIVDVNKNGTLERFDLIAAQLGDDGALVRAIARIDSDPAGIINSNNVIAGLLTAGSPIHAALQALANRPINVVAPAAPAVSAAGVMAPPIAEPVKGTPQAPDFSQIVVPKSAGYGDIAALSNPEFLAELQRLRAELNRQTEVTIAVANQAAAQRQSQEELMREGNDEIRRSTIGTAGIIS